MFEDVVDSRLGHEASDRGVRTSVIVEVDEASQRVEALAVRAIGPDVGPLVEQGPDEALGPYIVLLDIGGVLMPDSWQALLLTPGEGIADRLGLDVTRVEEAANLLWPEFSLQERTEQDWWQALGRMVGMTIPPKLVIEVETKLLKPLAGAAELIRRAQRLGDVGVISDNTSFWYQKQASRLGLERRILPSLRFLSFERQVAKSSAPIGLFEVAAEGLSGQKVVVLDDRNANCERARAVGFTAILIDPQRATSHV